MNSGGRASAIACEVPSKDGSGDESNNLVNFDLTCVKMEDTVSMELQAIITAARALVSAESVAHRGGSLAERLRENLESLHELLKEPDSGELSQELAELKARMAVEPCDVYWEFASTGLCLLRTLDSTLKRLQENEDLCPPEPSRQPSHPVAPPPVAPGNLLSVDDQKTVRSLVQFIVSLGLYRFLLPGVDTLIKVKMASAESVPKATSLSNNARAWHLSTSCKVLLRSFESLPFGPGLMSQYLSDVLAALLQVCYGPLESEDPRQRSGVGETSIGESRPTTASSQQHSDSWSYASAIKEREQSMEELKKLLNRVHQPLIVRELLALQSVSVGDRGAQKPRGKGSGRGAVTKSSSWLQRACGQLLSERLMQRNGVQHVLRGIFKATSGTASSITHRV